MGLSKHECLLSATGALGRCSAGETTSSRSPSGVVVSRLAPFDKHLPEKDDRAWHDDDVGDDDAEVEELPLMTHRCIEEP